MSSIDVVRTKNALLQRSMTKHDHEPQVKGCQEIQLESKRSAGAFLVLDVVVPKWKPCDQAWGRQPCREEDDVLLEHSLVWESAQDGPQGQSSAEEQQSSH